MNPKPNARYSDAGRLMSAIVALWPEQAGYTPSIEPMSGALCFCHDDPAYPLFYATPGWEIDPATTVSLQVSDPESGEPIEDELVPRSIELRVPSAEAYIAAIEPIVAALAARAAEAFGPATL